MNNNNKKRSIPVFRRGVGSNNAGPDNRITLSTLLWWLVGSFICFTIGTLTGLNTLHFPPNHSINEINNNPTTTTTVIKLPPPQKILPTEKKNNSTLIKFPPANCTLINSFPQYHLPKRQYGGVEPPNIKQIFQQYCPNNITTPNTNKQNLQSDQIYFQSLLDDLIGKEHCDKPLDEINFICKAKCAIDEPELERTIRIMRLADHTPQHVVNACLQNISPFLIWISGSNGNNNQQQQQQQRIRFLNCFGTFSVHAFMGKSVWREDMRLLFALSCLVKLPENIIFGFDWSDYPSAGVHHVSPQPIFRYMEPLPPILRPVGVDAHHALLFPTGSFIVATSLCQFRRVDEWWKICFAHERTRDHLKWEKRYPVVMWRGALNGVIWTVNDWRMQQRSRLVREFGSKRRNDSRFDVAFVQGIHARTEDGSGSFSGVDGVRKLAQMNQITENNAEDIVQEMVREHVMKSQIGKGDHPKYKYLLHVDGQTASWGLAHKLNSGSVLVWIESARNYREFYYPLLKPWIHYIPIARDLSDLDSITEWMFQHDDQVKEIVNQANILVDSRMRAQDLFCYVYRLLVSIQKAQRTQENNNSNSHHSGGVTEEWLKNALGNELFNRFEDVHDVKSWKEYKKKGEKVSR
jgi:hypothetical protein